MKHAKALGIKFIVVTIVILSLFGIFRDTSIWELLLMSVLVTGLAYVVGDLYTLPRAGNVVATIADFGLAFFSIWALSFMLMENNSSLITASLAAAGAITLSEILFHAYMKKKVFPNEENQTQTHTQTKQQLRPSYQTEIAEEYDVRTKDWGKIKPHDVETKDLKEE
ncbi:YndM family protein [Ferdinandcohnia sp. Marseille-Q9671]